MPLRSPRAHASRAPAEGGSTDQPGGRAGALRVTIATNVGVAGVNASTGLLAARLLGPTGRGELAAIQLWPTFLATVSLLGLPDALVYFAARDRPNAGRNLGTATAMALAAAAVAAFIGLLAMGLLLPRQNAEVVRSARIYLLLCPVFVFAGLPFHILRGVGQFGLWNVFRLSAPVLWLAVLVVAWATGSVNARVLPLWYLAALSALIVPIVITTVRRTGRPFRPDRALVRPLLRYGLPSLATSVPQVLNLRLDQMLMAAFIPSEQLGYYVAAVAWSAAVSPALTAVGSVLFPWVAEKSDPDEQASVVAQVSRVTVVLAAVTVVGVGVLTLPGLTLAFGNQFRPALVSALILVVASGVLGFAVVLEEALRGLGQPSAVLRAELYGTAAAVVGLAALLPTLGIAGAALASLLSYLVIAFQVLRRAARRLDLRARDLLRPTGADLALAWEGVRRVARAGRSRNAGALGE